MNKKLLIITTSSLVLTFILIGFVFYFQTFKTVRFDVKQTDITVTVFNDDDKEVATFNRSSDIRLQPGDYTLVTAGEKYDNSPKPFKVEGTDTTVTVDPPYSGTYREKILTRELPAITKVINDAYPTLIPGFILSKGDIYKDGLWYGATLTQVIPDTNEPGDVYRIVLKKEDAKWVIKAKPSLVLSAKQYPEIPVEILRSINTRGPSER